MDPPPPRGAASSPVAVSSWQSQWARVPGQWRQPVYSIDTAPFQEVFLRNQFYLRANHAGATHDFTPAAPLRFAQGIAWWVWWCWDQQLRKIEPSLLAWLVRTLPAAISEHTTRTGAAPASIADLDPTELIRQTALSFRRRNNRLPSAGSRRNISHLIEHLHLNVSVSCTEPDNGASVARLRYQQTKVDGIAIVDIIGEQQRWLTTKYPQLQPKYLFLGLKNQHRGQRPRSYTTYRAMLDKLDKCHTLTDRSGRALRFTQTHRLRHTRATELLNDGVPFHVVQRYLGHKSPEMTARYAATLAATAEAEFLKHKKIGAHGADIDITPHDIYEMTQMAARTDRVLPNGVCLLPPLKQCDKGNACLGCGHFATDTTHLDELRAQLAATEALIQTRRDQYRQRAGRELGDDNIWIIERHREIDSLHAIIDRLAATADNSVAGPGTGKRLPRLQIQTRGAHQSALDKASRPRTGEQ